MFAFIGGSGFYDFPELENFRTIGPVKTPFGDVADIYEGHYQGERVIFLPRHGAGHGIPPHKINYRANIAALSSLGVEHVIAFNACGGITSQCPPGCFVLPDQLVDYTWGREHTFSDGFISGASHIEFGLPFDDALRSRLAEVLEQSSEPHVIGGTYGCTQGPRLESNAEIVRMRRDGCDLVGMTAMPEAALAKEKGMAYASLCLVVNWAAGVDDVPISLDQIMARIELSIPKIRDLMLKTSLRE